MATFDEARTVRQALQLALGQDVSEGQNPGESKNTQSITVETTDNSPSRVFALLIGINKYKYPNQALGVCDLAGCVADATDIEQYLLGKLSTPSSRIQKLYNEQATRQNIKDAIRALGTNPNIDRDDPIVIFYAGHGSRARPPKSWSDSDIDGPEYIEMILPHDFNPQNAQEDPEASEGIPDITFRILLAKLAREKGNNITVIFDCCHSGSGTRTGVAANLGLVRRGIELPESYHIPDALDADVVPEKTRGIVSANRSSGAGSHVLLAACRPDEQANEYPYSTESRGIFTKYLVRLLNSPGSETLTYKQIIERLPSNLHQFNQHPQCEGANSSYLLFNGRVRGNKTKRAYRVRSWEGQWMMDAGEVDGITPEARFDLFANEDASGRSLGSATVQYTAVAKSSVHLDFSPPNPQIFWAIQTHAGKRQDIRTSIPVIDAFKDVFGHLAKQMNDMRDLKRSIQLVEEGEEADLTLQPVEAQNNSKRPEVAFLIGHQLCRTYGLTQLHDTVPLQPNDIDIVLSSAADFYWHLRRTSSNRTRLTGDILIECFQLEEKEDEQLEILDFAPVGNDLLQDGILTVSDFVEEGEEGEEEEEETSLLSPYYGLTITNHTKLPIYAAIFFFNMSDLSIEPLYYPPSARGGKVEPSILPGGVLTVGYASAGWAPLQFTLPKLSNGQRAEVDVGYVKAFFSTQYVDLESIKQESPLQGIQARRDAGAAKRPQEPPFLWDTEDFAVVMQRKK